VPSPNWLCGGAFRTARLFVRLRGMSLLFNGAPLWRRDEGGTMRELPPLRSALPPISPAIQTVRDRVPCLN
jgi:hypothetical protein